MIPQSLGIIQKHRILIISIIGADCGMSEDHLPTLFKKFGKIERVRDDRHKGTGLRLWRCDCSLQGK